MGIASRHAGAPYVNGETLSGTDLEQDIANVYAQVNGNLSDVNIATAAGISGTKIADASLAGGKLTDATVTLAKLATTAAANYKVVNLDTTATIAVSGGTWTNVEGVIQQNFGPGNVGDLVVLFFQGTFSHTMSASPGSIGAIQLGIRFSQNAVFTSQLSTMKVISQQGVTNSQTIAATWIYAATSTSLIAAIPQYNQVLTGVQIQGVWSQRLFTCLVIPAKVS